LCDPDDANAMVAYVPTDCANGPQVLAPTAGETRDGVPRFDNVGDYHNYGPISPIKDMQGQAIVGLENYSVKVIQQTSCGADCIQIDVTVSSGDVSVMLTGYRYRYAPRALP
jgi:MSHA pilin protein MshD